VSVAIQSRLLTRTRKRGGRGCRWYHKILTDLGCFRRLNGNSAGLDYYKLIGTDIKLAIPISAKELDEVIWLKNDWSRRRRADVSSLKTKSTTSFSGMRDGLVVARKSEVLAAVQSIFESSDNNDVKEFIFYNFDLFHVENDLPEEE
jgi:hypothetical protein